MFYICRYCVFTLWGRDVYQCNKVLQKDTLPSQTKSAFSLLGDITTAVWHIIGWHEGDTKNIE